MTQQVTSASEWRSLEGQVIDGMFFLTEFLGTGSYAGVFQADHVVRDKLIQRVAIKLISEQPSVPLEQLLNEATLWANQKHPSILTCSHVGECRLREVDYIYLVMELATDSLDRQIARGSLSEIDVFRLASDLLGALHYLHSSVPPIIHRDLKPANILKVSEHWKIGDFGTARQLTASFHQQHSAWGTPAYAPPESIDGIQTTAWDMWSLGVVLFEALTGDLPFAGNSVAEIRQSAVNIRLVIPKGTHTPLASVIRRCLAIDHLKRINVEQATKAFARKPEQSKHLHVPGDYTTLGDAVANVEQGQEIILGPGVWSESIVIDTPVSLIGAKQDSPTVISADTGATITVRSEKVRICNITIRSHDSCGLVAERDACVELEGVEVGHCRKYGLVALEGSVVKMSSSRVNHSQQSNCRVNAGAVLNSTDSVFERSRQGCGVIIEGAFQATRCFFTGNSNAGVWTESGGVAQIDHSYFEDNTLRGVYAAKGSRIRIATSSFLRNGSISVDQADGSSVEQDNNTLR